MNTDDDIPGEASNQMSGCRIRAFIFLLLLSIMTAAYPIFSIFVYGFVRSNESADVAIVLGAAVWHDRASPVFVERIRHAVDLRRSGKVDYIIFTGGKGEPHEHAESIVARDLAVDWGESPETTLFETRSHNTYENLALASEEMRRNNLASALIVSDPPHMRRATAIARDIGMDCAPSPTPTTRVRSMRSNALFILREYGNYVYYLIWGRFRLPPDLSLSEVE